MLFLPTIYREAFTDVHTLQDNPLATLDRRRSERRLSDKVILLICVAVLWATMFFTIWVWNRAQFITHHIPAFMGGNYGAMLLIAVCGIHFWFVSFTAHRRTNQFFLQEYRRGSLQALLSTPFAPFQLVLQATIFPFLHAMLVAAAGLPFYVYFLHLGGVSWLELAALYLVFTMAAFAPPRWRVPVFGGLSPQDIQRKKKRGRGTTGREAIFIFWIISLFFGWILYPIFGYGWQWQILAPLGDLLDKHVRELLPSLVLGWPYMLSRWLLTSISFYSFHLPPILFIVPLYLISQVLSIWHTSMYLRTEDERQLERLWDLGAFWKLRFSFTVFAAFIGLGFCWKPYVSSMITASLVVLRLPGPGQELAGLLWLIGIAAAFMFWERIFRFKQANGAIVDPYSAQYVRREIRWSAQPLIAFYGLYVVGCLISWRSPLEAPAAKIATAVIAGTFVGALIIRSLPPNRSTYLAIMGLPLTGFFIPNFGWVAGLSPVASFLCLTPHTQRIANVLSPIPVVIPSWQAVVIAGLVAGALLNALAYSRSRNRSDFAQPAAEPTQKPLPFELPSEVEGSRRRKPFREKKDQPAAQALLGWLYGRLDNAVAIKELRVLLRGRLGFAEMAAFGILFAVPILAPCIRPDISALILGPASELFYGKHFDGAGGLVTQIATLLCFIVTPIFPMVMAYQAGTAFGKERDRSTLGFLLITPMRTSAILWGKIVGIQLTSSMLLGGLIIVNLLLSAILIPLIGPISALRGLVLTSAIPMLFCIAGTSFGLLFATLFRKESDASGVALLFIMAYFGLVFYVDFLVGGATWQSSLIEGTIFWEVCLAVLTGLTASVCCALAYARLEMIRAGDIKFGPGGKR